MEDGGWRHPTGNRPQLRVGGGGGGNCREWAGKRTAGDGAHSGDSSTAQVCYGFILEQRGWSSAGQQRDLLGSNMRHCIGRCRVLPLARPFAVDVTECGAGDYAERSGPHTRLCSFHASLRSVGRSVRPSFRPCSISVGRLPLLSVGLQDASQLPSFPSFLPSFSPSTSVRFSSCRPRRLQSSPLPPPRRPLPSLRLLCQFMVGKEVEAAERAHQKTERAHRATTHSQLHACGECKATLIPFVILEHPEVDHIYRG